jgi:uncharacterized membrane protein
MKKKYNNYINQDYSFDKITMLGIFCLLIVITGCFGWLYEFIFYYFNGKMQYFYWRGSNFLPWINIYATGSIMIYFLTYKLRKKPLKVFLISTISCGILEYFSGLGMYIIGDGLRCWDYNQEILNFGNINGFVCLRSVLIFGIFSLLLIYTVIPICFYLARKMNKKVFLTISIILCSIILIDEFYNLLFARIFSLPRAKDIYSSIGVHYVTFK